MSLTGVPEPLLREATQLLSQSRTLEALEAYRRILARWPDSADSWFNLAFLQRQTRDLHGALESYQKALDAGVSHPEEAHLNRSVIYADYLRDFSAAESELNKALSVNPNFLGALLNLGNLCEDFGRRAEALTAYSKALAVDPRCFEALARFANLQPRTGADPALVPILRRALADPTLPDIGRAGLGFALGRLLDAAGDYPAAFAAYTQANRASRASAGAHFVPYDRPRQERFIDRLIAGGGAQTSRATPRAQQRPQPIFVCGMFRSGSTLTEQLLATCPGVAAGGELNFLPRVVNTELVPFHESLANLTTAQLDEIATRYRAELTRVSADARYVIDKRPDNFLYIGLIKRLFPDAKIVHTTRNPLDNCLSIYFLHLDQQMSYALDLMDIGHYYREYRRMMAHWKTQFGADIIDFDYDRLVRDPQPAMQTLCASLGLDWPGGWPPPAAVDQPVRTASVWQVREPLYQSSSGRAAHYGPQLEDLRRYLATLPAA